MRQESCIERFKRRIKTKRYRVWLGKRIIVCTVFAAVVSVPFFVVRGGEAKAAEKSVEVVVMQAVEPEKTAVMNVPEIVEVVAEEQPVKEAQTMVSVNVYDVPLDVELQLFIIRECEKHHIEPTVILGMAQRESNFTADVIGDGGDSFGMWQVQPRWHQDRMNKLGVTDLLDPKQNVVVAIDYLAEMLDWYDEDIAKALTAYNQGSFKGVVSNYAKAVLENSENIKKGMVQMYYTDDPLSDFDRWDADQQKQIGQLPVCADCGQHIQDERAYYINGEWICMNCMSCYEREVLPE